MSSLKDQMLKLGLVSEQQARRSKHDKRVENKGRGPGGVQADRAQRRAAAEAERARRRAADRSRERSRQAGTQASEEERRVAQIVESGRLGGRTGGPRRFYFESRGGMVPMLEVNDEVADALARGRAAVAESPEGVVSLIEAEAAERVAALDPSWLVVFRR